MYVYRIVAIALKRTIACRPKQGQTESALESATCFAVYGFSFGNYASERATALSDRDSQPIARDGAFAVYHNVRHNFLLQFSEYKVGVAVFYRRGSSSARGFSFL